MTFAFINTGSHLLSPTDHSDLPQRQAGRRRDGAFCLPSQPPLRPSPRRRAPTEPPSGGTPAATGAGLPAAPPGGTAPPAAAAASPRSPHPRPVPATEERREEGGRRPAAPLAPLTQAHEQHRLRLPRRHLRSRTATRPGTGLSRLSRCLASRFTAPAVTAGYIFCLI